MWIQHSGRVCWDFRSRWLHKTYSPSKDQNYSECYFTWIWKICCRNVSWWTYPASTASFLAQPEPTRPRGLTGRRAVSTEKGQETFLLVFLDTSLKLFCKHKSYLYFSYLELICVSLICISVCSQGILVWKYR